MSITWPNVDDIDRLRVQKTHQATVTVVTSISFLCIQCRDAMHDHMSRTLLGTSRSPFNPRRATGVPASVCLVT